MRKWIVVGIVLQVAMVVAGHAVPALQNFWGPGGMLISGVVGSAAVHGLVKRAPAV